MNWIFKSVTQHSTVCFVCIAQKPQNKDSRIVLYISNNTTIPIYQGYASIFKHKNINANFNMAPECLK